MTLEELKRLAEKATPGPWIVSQSVRETDGCEIMHSSGKGVIAYDVIIEDGRFLAACSPERILAMIRVIEAATAWRITLDDREVATFDAALDALFALSQ